MRKCTAACAKPGLHVQLLGLQVFSSATFKRCVPVKHKQGHPQLRGTQKWGEMVGWEEPRGHNSQICPSGAVLQECGKHRVTMTDRRKSSVTAVPEQTTLVIRLEM